MLTRLYIKDFALIQEVAMEFGAGLNVITGETGAGKSILMGALYSILGGQASADLVRNGAERCLVEGVFEFDDGHPAAARLQIQGIELEDGQLILRREIRANGRSRALVNGLTVPVRNLREVGGILVDLHGQHEHQTLLDPRSHTGFLDAFGGLTGRLETVAARFRDVRSMERQVNRLLEERDALVEEEEFRRRLLSEIRSLAPEPGEDERLEQELRILENAESMLQTCSALFELLYQADGSIVEQLGRGRREMERLTALDPSLAATGEALEGLVYGVEDVAAQLRDYMHKLEVQPERTEHMRERLEALRRLRKKHGGTLDMALQKAVELEDQEHRTGVLDTEIGRAREEHDRVREAYAAQCRQLSVERTHAAAELAEIVERGLVALGMPQVRFHVELHREEDPSGITLEGDERRWQAGETGAERAAFILAPNPGETPRPLERIASGGEISRIMLALKEVIAERDTVSTLVFDEIDAGISGRIAAAVGRKLHNLAQSHQVILITHLPQIASAAARHFSVRKREENGRTLTRVHQLRADERAEEVARLLAGDMVSETALQHAQEMLK